MGRRLVAVAALVVAVPVGGASAAPPTASPSATTWAAQQIRTLASHGLLMGASSIADFRAADPLTRGALASLALGLQHVFMPPSPAPPASAAPTTAGGAPEDSGQGLGSQTAQVRRPDAVVSMSELDARLVSLLGLSRAAAEFQQGAQANGLTVPGRFGTEVVARLLGLRTNHPPAQDFLEPLPDDPATRAEAAYSAARILALGPPSSSGPVAFVQSLADSFSLPQLTDWQRLVLDVAVSKIGMPYVWGGTSDGPEAPTGVEARGGYDCSGFIWRVYKLENYPNGGTLASTLRGRTTEEMSTEVPRSERVPLAELQPADVLFFGTRGPRSTGRQIDHAGIYLGNGWFIHESNQGVALAPLAGSYRQSFAWGRSPLQEAGLTS